MCFRLFRMWYVSVEVVLIVINFLKKLFMIVCMFVKFLGEWIEIVYV